MNPDQRTDAQTDTRRKKKEETFSEPQKKEWLFKYLQGTGDSSQLDDPKWQHICEDASPANSIMLPFINFRQFHPEQGLVAERNRGKIHRERNDTAHLVSKKRAEVEKQNLKNEIPGFSLASLRQKVCTSTACVPVRLPSSQYSTSLDRGIKGSKIYCVPTRFCGMGSWGQKGSVCLCVFGRLQSKLNAGLDSTNPSKGEQCGRRNRFARSLHLLLRTEASGWQERRQSRSTFFGRTLLVASQGLEGCSEQSLLRTRKEEPWEHSPQRPPHRARGAVPSPSTSPGMGSTAEGTQPLTDVLSTETAPRSCPEGQGWAATLLLPAPRAAQKQSPCLLCRASLGRMAAEPRQDVLKHLKVPH